MFDPAKGAPGSLLQLENQEASGAGTLQQVLNTGSDISGQDNNINVGDRLFSITNDNGNSQLSIAPANSYLFGDIENDYGMGYLDIGKNNTILSRGNGTLQINTDDLGSAAPSKILGKDVSGNNHYYSPSGINNLIQGNWQLNDGWSFADGVLTDDGTATGNVLGNLTAHLKENTAYRLRTVTTGTGGIVVLIADGNILVSIAAGDNTDHYVTVSNTVDTDISIGANVDGFTGTIDSIELVEVPSLENTLDANIPWQADHNTDTNLHKWTVNGNPIGRDYKKYTCQLFQSNDNNPFDNVLGVFDLTTANTLQNNSIIWSRTGTGDYNGNLPGAFPVNLTTFKSSGISSNFTYVVVTRVDNDNINVQVKDLELAPVDGLTAYDLEIQVYATNSYND